MGILTKLAGAFFNSVIGGIIRVWESMRRDADNRELGAKEVIIKQKEDEVERAKEAIKTREEVRSDSDADAIERLRNR